MTCYYFCPKVLISTPLELRTKKVNIDIGIIIAYDEKLINNTIDNNNIETIPILLPHSKC